MLKRLAEYGSFDVSDNISNENQSPASNNSQNGDFVSSRLATPATPQSQNTISCIEPERRLVSCHNKGILSDRNCLSDQVVPTAQSQYEPNNDINHCNEIDESKEQKRKDRAKEYGFSLPPEPIGECPKRTQNIVEFYTKFEKSDISKWTQDSKKYRNPSYYAKLIQLFNIDELGTNFSPDVYDPASWIAQMPLIYGKIEERQRESEYERNRKILDGYHTSMIKEAEWEAKKMKTRKRAINKNAGKREAAEKLAEKKKADKKEAAQKRKADRRKAAEKNRAEKIEAAKMIAEKRKADRKEAAEKKKADKKEAAEKKKADKKIANMVKAEQEKPKTQRRKRKLNQPGISTSDILTGSSDKDIGKKPRKPRNIKGTRIIKLAFDAIELLPKISPIPS